MTKDNFETLLKQETGGGNLIILQFCVTLLQKKKKEKKRRKKFFQFTNNGSRNSLSFIQNDKKDNNFQKQYSLKKNKEILF